MEINFFGDEKLAIKAWIFMHNLEKKQIIIFNNYLSKSQFFNYIHKSMNLQKYPLSAHNIYIYKDKARN